jgi:hypothetical protein
MDRILHNVRSSCSSGICFFYLWEVIFIGRIDHAEGTDL